MRKEKNKKNLTNEDWIKEKYIFNTRYTINSESKKANISKLYNNINGGYTDTVHLSKQFLERFFK